MKKPTINSFILIIFIFSSIQSINGQTNFSAGKEVFYWFNIGVNLAVNQQSKNPETNVYRVYKGISSGEFNKFEETFHKKLMKNVLCVGPFESEDLARIAKDCYENLMKKSVDNDKLGKLSQESGDFYYFLTSPVHSEENKKIRFERFPAAIAQGSIKDFSDLLFEGIIHQKLAIGPFMNYISAEKSKFITRKYGEQNSGSYENSAKSDNELKKMADGWKSLDFELTTNRQEIENSFIECNLKIIFPAGYFNENALIVISFGARSNTLNLEFTEGLSLQGYKFSDNNSRLVSYDEGGSAKYSTRIPNTAEEEIRLVVKATIINNTSLYECEPVYLDVKSK